MRYSSGGVTFVDNSQTNNDFTLSLSGDSYSNEWNFRFTITGNNQGAEHIPRAPRSLIETTRIFQKSDIARDFLGDTFVDHFAATRDWEWRQWLDGVTDWEMKRYFEII